MVRKFKHPMALLMPFVMCAALIPSMQIVYTDAAERGNEDKVDKDVSIQTASGRDGKYVQEIGGEWYFGGRNFSESNALSADRSSWEKVTVPHTWNAKDGEDGGGNYDRTKYWYHKDIVITKEQLNKSVYTEFLGSNTKTSVYVNGAKAGDTHKGGYTAFRYDISNMIKEGTNTLDVCVDNTYDQTIAPISGDFNMYGGIYRRVYMITTDKVHIDLDDNGSSGIFLVTDNMRSKTRPDDLGKFNIKSRLVNDEAQAKKVTVVASIEGENAPEPIAKEVTIPANGILDYNQVCTIENPVLWEGIRYTKDADNSKVGYRYTVTLEVKDGDTVIDAVSDKIGFRYFWIDSQDNGESGEGFFLNGEKYPLRGVNRHSYMKGVGSAMTEEQHYNDMKIMKELGINTVRLCHYPQTDYFYDLCDENGIVVWTEIPIVNEIRGTKEFANTTKQQLTDLIKQQGNRPSVVFWGLENEIGNGSSLTNAKGNANNVTAKKFLWELDGMVKEMDPSNRYTTQAFNRDYGMNQNKPDSVNTDFDTNVGWKSDIVAWNIYPGWYPDANFYGTFDDVMKRKTSGDSRSMGISEYGWGANVNQHEENPILGVNDLNAGGKWHPEEYQNIMNEEALEYINNHDELWGTYYWVMFDFAVDSRNEGSQPALNDKGLVTADRKIKKDSFYLYKANWNKADSFTYISSRRWTKRENSITTIKVYSNCEKVELFINGESKGQMVSKGNGVFVMEDVNLGYGEVTVKTVGTNTGDTKEYTDTCTWTREISAKADLQSNKFAVDTATKTIAVGGEVTLETFMKEVRGINNAVYAVYDKEKEVTDSTTLIIPGMTIHVTAEDNKTTETYTVINSNLCLKKTVTTSSNEAGNVPENAVDGNTDTNWTASSAAYPQTLTVDLGQSYILGNLSLTWGNKDGTRYYQYYVSVSEDGTNYYDIIDRRDNTQMNTVTDSLELVKARYIRVTVTGAKAGWATIIEVRADGYAITSDTYTIDDDYHLIIVDEIPTSGLADSVFTGNLKFEGNYGHQINYSSGWIHEGNTVDILDGNNGKVATYTICTKDNKKDYMNDSKLKEQTIKIDSSHKMVAKKTEQIIKLNPTVLGKAKVTYTSNSKKITVNKTTGKVTIPKNYSGKAVITIKAESTSVYMSETKDVLVIVKPEKIKEAGITVESSEKKMLHVKYRKAIGAVKYKVEVSTTGNFTKSSTKVITTKKSNVTFKELVSGKKYYVRVTAIGNNNVKAAAVVSLKTVSVK